MLAELDARNVRLFGTRFGFVEDLATSPVVAAHPQYYTHNVNLGGLSFSLMQLIGIQTFEGRQTVILLIWGLGLVYAYLCVAHFSRSRLCGLVMLLFLVTDFPFSQAYSAHALRTWQWLPIFGLPLHLDRFRSHRGRLDVLLTAVMFMVSFGMGYDFWIIMLAVTGLVYVTGISWSGSRAWQRLIVDGLLIGSLAMAPFILRQAHIVAVLGWEYWQFDFINTIGIKIPFVNSLIRVPEIADLDAWYRRHNVMRPPAAPITADGLLIFFATLRKAIEHVTLPSAGLLTVAMTVTVGLGGLVSMIPRRTRHPVGGALSDDGTDPYSIDVRSLSRYVSCMLVGSISGMVVTPSVAVLYVLYNPPLIVAPLFAAKALVVTMLVSGIARTVSQRRHAVAAILAAGVLIIAADHVVISEQARARSTTMDVSWIPVVRSMPEATFAVSYIGQSVAAYTDNWAVHVGSTGFADKYFRLVANGQQPFTQDDLFFFGEKDPSVDFTRPDYWLYFSIDQRIHMFDPEPACYSDYMTDTLRRGLQAVLPSPSYEASLKANPDTVRPGSDVLLSGQLKGPSDGVQSIEIVVNGERRPLVYNCVSGALNAHYTVPESVAAGTLPITILLTKPDGSTVTLPATTVSVDAQAPPTTFPSRPGRRQPSVASVLRDYPNLRIVAVGPPTSEHDGYVLIDLRGTVGR